LWFAFFVCAGTLAGLIIIQKIVKKLGRPSILIFILVGVLICAALVTLIEESIDYAG